MPVNLFVYCVAKPCRFLRVLAGRKIMKSLESEGVTQSLLIITGTMGSGKTAVLAEASDLVSSAATDCACGH